MQRVLSFQMARGLGESSEFVTKRMCFSCVFSVGFLSLLAGFLLGRFAIERTLQMRADRARLEFADNGLGITGHLQHRLLQILQEATFDDNYVISADKVHSKQSSIHGIKEILMDFKFFQKIVETRMCTIATARGYREPDRYVVFSASGDGIGLAIELAKSFDRIHVEQDWNPRRTIIFCMFLGSSDFCHKELPAYVQSKVIAYIAVHGNAIQENGYFVTSGSDMVQAMIMQSIDRIRYSNIIAQNTLDRYIVQSEKNMLPRLTLDMPHAVLSFAYEKNISTIENQENENLEMYRKILAQILGMSIWRLSDSVIIRWNPERFNETVYEALKTINDIEFEGAKDKVRLAVTQIVNDIKRLNEKLDEMEKTKYNRCLNVRMMNDLLLDLDRALLCSDKSSFSKTDLVIFSRFPQESASIITTHLNEIEKCYETATSILQHQ